MYCYANSPSCASMLCYEVVFSFVSTHIIPISILTKLLIVCLLYVLVSTCQHAVMQELVAYCSPSVSPIVVLAFDSLVCFHLWCVYMYMCSQSTALGLFIVWFYKWEMIFSGIPTLPDYVRTYVRIQGLPSLCMCVSIYMVCGAAVHYSCTPHCHLLFDGCTYTRRRYEVR